MNHKVGIDFHDFQHPKSKQAHEKQQSFLALARLLLCRCACSDCKLSVQFFPTVSNSLIYLLPNGVHISLLRHILLQLNSNFVSKYYYFISPSFSDPFYRYSNFQINYIIIKVLTSKLKYLHCNLNGNHECILVDCPFLIL